jgi:hypothetical protein
MRHVLAPTEEDLEGKEGERIIVAAGIVIDPVSLHSIIYIARKRLKWCKGDGMEGCVVQNPAV